MSAPEEVNVRFSPSGTTGVVPAGSTVLDAAIQLGVDLDSVCGGRGICGRCQVGVGGPSESQGLSERTSTEDSYDDRRGLGSGRRLGCCAVILDDVALDVPAESQRHRPVISKDIDLAGLAVDPTVRLMWVDVPPDDEPLDDRLATAVCEAFGDNPRIDRGVRAHLFAALGGVTASSSEPAPVSVALRDGAVVGVWPGRVERLVGVAVDLGSTTIAAHLVDLGTGEILSGGGAMNPQIRLGDDLMARVSYAMTKPTGTRELAGAVQNALDELIGGLLDDAKLDRSHVVEIVVVGNPVMGHLLYGIDPTPLGQAPFPLASAAPMEARAREIGIDAPFAQVWLGPSVGGHLGSDVVAAVLDSGVATRGAPVVLVDVGTNAEIVLAVDGRILACSSPTGPALEGGQLSCGQRAVVGAIERLDVDPATLALDIGVIGDVDQPSGLCGSGVVDALSQLRSAGILAPDGTFDEAAAERCDALVGDGRTLAFELPGGAKLTQSDVRAVQLAKAALRAGIELLLDHAGRPPLSAVMLTGAFGAHLRPSSVIGLGMIPDVGANKVEILGNAAGAGAVRALVSAQERSRMVEISERIERIETATDPGFQNHFVAAMAIPHADAAGSSGSPRRRGGRRRRR